MRKLLKFAIEMTEEAGRMMLFYRSRIRSVTYKTPKSIVTEADLVIQKMYNETISRKFPTHKIIGEEESYQPAGEISDFTWVIDPIDGTTNYVAGLDYFCTSVALIHEAEPVVGVIFAPAYNRYLFTAEIGRGAFLDDRPIQVKETEILSDMVGAFDFKGEQGFTGYEEKIIKICRAGRSPGALALELAEVAAGRYDFHLHYKPKIWDCAAGELLISEAGGRIYNFESGLHLGSSTKAFEQIKNLLSTLK
jgi:myo-inositol-1(or 4)-monophosphatase